MGTNGMYAVIINKEVKIAQYGQWDSDPTGNGATMLNFFKNLTSNSRFFPYKMDEFRTKIQSLTWLTKEQLEKIDKDPEWKQKYPYLSRDTGADIFEMIMEQDIVGLKNNYDFADDSLFCENAYVVDLDKGTFEYYKGFNEDPLKEGDRFYSMQKLKTKENSYYPVKIVKSYDLYNLPSEDEFIEETTEKDEQ